MFITLPTKYSYYCHLSNFNLYIGYHNYICSFLGSYILTVATFLHNFWTGSWSCWASCCVLAWNYIPKDFK